MSLEKAASHLMSAALFLEGGLTEDITLIVIDCRRREIIIATRASRRTRKHLPVSPDRTRFIPAITVLTYRGPTWSVLVQYRIYIIRICMYGCMGSYMRPRRVIGGLMYG